MGPIKNEIDFSKKYTPNKLFVYGTLRPKFGVISFSKDKYNHLGQGTIKGVLIDLGGIPGAIKVGKSVEVIKGDLLEIAPELFDKIDYYESEGNLYNRIITTAKLADREMEVWVYEFNYKRFTNIPYSIIIDGEWEDHNKIIVSNR